MSATRGRPELTCGDRNAGFDPTLNFPRVSFVARVSYAIVIADGRERSGHAYGPKIRQTMQFSAKGFLSNLAKRSCECRSFRVREDCSTFPCLSPFSPIIRDSSIDALTLARGVGSTSEPVEGKKTCWSRTVLTVWRSWLTCSVGAAGVNSGRASGAG
jgi:hypothetical protein